MKSYFFFLSLCAFAIDLGFRQQKLNRRQQSERRDWRVETEWQNQAGEIHRGLRTIATLAAQRTNLRERLGSGNALAHNHRIVRAGSALLARGGITVLAEAELSEAGKDPVVVAQ